MTAPIRLSLRHRHRGSWFAGPGDVRTRHVLGEAPIAVIRDVDDGCWTWIGRTDPEFRKEGDSEWFGAAARPEWLRHFEDGAVVWVRGGVRGPGTRAEGSKGVWRIGAVEKGENLLAFRLVERIGDVR